MRKKYLLIFGTLLFISWASIQLYLFVHEPQSNRFRHPFPWFMSNGPTSDKLISDKNNNLNGDDRLRNGTKNKQKLDSEMINMKLDYLETDLFQQTKHAEIILRLLKNIRMKLTDAKNRTLSDVVTMERDNLMKSVDINNFDQKKPVICVLLFACNRITVKRNLDQLFKYRTDPEIFPVVVSQDCNHEPTRQIIESYGDKLQYIQQPDQSDIELKGKNQKKFKGYYKIARHYGWALNYTFNRLNYDTVLIVEDDLDIAPDFFEYFLAMYPILKSDISLYCISAWNDNGKDALVEDDATKLFRSDFFPGLGWMLTKDLWLEFQNKWPKAFWDDWIRQPEQRKNRACIRPEISRTKTFGKKGVSNGLFYEKHLKFIKLNEKFVPFTKMNLSYLMKENYDIEFLKQVYNSRLMSVYDVKNLPKPSTSATVPSVSDPKFGIRKQNVTTKYWPLWAEHSVRIQYENRAQFKRAAKMFGLMDDFKSGVPRTGYQGTVGFWHNGFRVYLAPSPIWSGYNVTWK